MKGPNPLIMLMCLSILFMLNNAKRNDKKISESLRANNMEYIDDDYVSISQVKLPKPLVTTCPLFVDDLPYAEDLGYYEYTVGSITYLVDSQRRIISGGYFDHYKKDGVIYGKMAVNSEIVVDSNKIVNNTGGNNKYRQDDIDRLQSVVDFLTDEYVIKQNGSVLSIYKHDERVSDEYFSFFVESGKLFGEKAISVEEIEL